MTEGRPRLSRSPGTGSASPDDCTLLLHNDEHRAASGWLHIVPWGMFKLMKHIKEKYGNPPMIITENGMDDANNPFSRLENDLRDDKRIQYYMSSLLDAIRKEGCNVHGYFVWSLLDNWGWNSGYTVRFGLYYVDYNNNLTRIPKASMEWFRQVLAQKTTNLEYSGSQ
ncbi:beta-glucosidase 25-like [Miscanthus floridulus]|uniref:beta-glucosidase 25-like n=1 Tax=Miscanthus floridulus TaxID=154761 RepID=UPI00345745C4